MAAGIWNALSGAQRSSTVLDAIAHPNVLNPAADLTAAATAAGSMYDVRQKMANQQLGQLYQQAIDPNTGRFDPLKFQGLIASAGPGVSMAAGEGVKSGAELQTNQFNLARAQNSAINDAVSAALLQKDPNAMKQAVVLQMRRLVQNGVIPQDLADHSLLNLSGDPNTLRAQLETLRQQTLPSSEATGMIYGAPFTYTAPGGARAGGTQDPRTGALQVPGQPGVPQGVSPEADQPVSWTDNNNVTQHTLLSDYQTAIRQGRAKGSAFDVNGKPIPGTGPSPSVAPRQPSSASQAPPPPPPGATLRGSTSGAYKPPTGPQGGNQSPPPQPAPTPNQPQGAVTPPPSLSGPTVATTSTQQQDQDAYKGDVAQMQDMVRRNVAGNAALDALELARTGPGTSTVAQKLAFLQAQGIPLPFGPDPNDYSSAANYEVLQKNLLRFAQNSSQTSGTDLGLQTQIASNADADHMVNAANRHVVLQDLGLLRQRMAMVRQQDASGVGYRDQQKNFPLDTDATAFAWDKMNPAERQAYLTKIDPKGTKDTPAFQKWSKSMAIARDTGVWQQNPASAQ